MKTILSVALVLGLCGLARAADEKADPVGTWKIEYSIGDQQRTATLTITKDGELTFSAVRELGENKIPIDYKFTIDGDKLKGKGTVENGGQKTDFDITGTREKKGK